VLLFLVTLEKKHYCNVIRITDSVRLAPYYWDYGPMPYLAFLLVSTASQSTAATVRVTIYRH